MSSKNVILPPAKNVCHLPVLKNGRNGHLGLNAVLHVEGDLLKGPEFARVLSARGTNQNVSHAILKFVQDCGAHGTLGPVVVRHVMGDFSNDSDLVMELAVLVQVATNKNVIKIPVCLVTSTVKRNGKIGDSGQIAVLHVVRENN